jgi:outer membrane lipoprotein carrier protein
MHYLLRIFLILLIGSRAYGQEPSQAFDDLMASFSSISGAFVQTIYAESGEIIDQQRGRMSLQKPRLIRWETADPRQIMVCDGDSIYLYDPDLEQVVIRPWRDDPTQNPVSLFTADVKLIKWFEISRVGSSFELRPIQQGSLINVIQVFVDESGKPSGFRVSDQPGQVNEVQFEDVDFDVNLTPTTFSFAVPDGVDVIVDD